MPCVSRVQGTVTKIVGTSSHVQTEDGPVVSVYPVCPPPKENMRYKVLLLPWVPSLLTGHPIPLFLLLVNRFQRLQLSINGLDRQCAESGHSGIKVDHEEGLGLCKEEMT